MARRLVMMVVLAGSVAFGESPTKELVLFDGKTLTGWKVTDFGGQGEVYVEEGKIVLEMGSDLTGITLEDPAKVPTQNYEVTLEAIRLNGGDFFCGLTFPVEKESCSLIVGGWGGGLVGISSLDGRDASENQTGAWHELVSDRWYKIRVWVEPSRIRAWIDDKRVVNADIEGKKIDVRGEVRLSKPFGVATWRTTGGVRNIRVRRLTEADKSKVDPEEDE